MQEHRANSILAKRSAVSPEMAIRLGRSCGNGAGPDLQEMRSLLLPIKPPSRLSRDT